MLLTVAFIASTLLFLELAPLAHAFGWPCNEIDKPLGVCAIFMAPYSDNAYYWANACGLSVSPETIIADSRGIAPWPYDITDW